MMTSLSATDRAPVARFASQQPSLKSNPPTSDTTSYVKSHHYFPTTFYTKPTTSPLFEIIALVLH